MNRPLLAPSVALATMLVVCPGGAHAEETVDRETASSEQVPTSGVALLPTLLHLELAAHASYASPPVRGGLNPFGLGAGGGISILVAHVILGAGATVYAGSRDDAGTSESGILYGIESGYEFRLGPRVTLRPTVGAGIAAVTHTLPSSTATGGEAAPTTFSRTPRVEADIVTQASPISGGGSSGSSAASSTTANSFYLAPGLALTVSLSPSVFAAVAGRGLYMPSVSYGPDTTASWMSYALDLGGGLHF